MFFGLFGNDKMCLWRVYNLGFFYIICSSFLLFLLPKYNILIYIVGYYILPCSCFWIFDVFYLFKCNCSFKNVLKFKFYKLKRSLQ